jgi:hypothetical protein
MSDDRQTKKNGHVALLTSHIGAALCSRAKGGRQPQGKRSAVKQPCAMLCEKGLVDSRDLDAICLSLAVDLPCKCCGHLECGPNSAGAPITIMRWTMAKEIIATSVQVAISIRGTRRSLGSSSGCARRVL